MLPTFEFHRQCLRRNWTEVQFAAVTGINQVYLSLMEQGRMTPSEDELARMARALGVASPSLLMRRVPDEPLVDEPQVQAEAR
jgi:transcriptional regulator with XRE-family HTH domain